VTDEQRTLVPSIHRTGILLDAGGGEFRITHSMECEKCAEPAGGTCKMPSDEFGRRYRVEKVDLTLLQSSSGKKKTR